jgi:hypothetical protein
LLPHPEILGWVLSREIELFRRDALTGLVDGGVDEYLRFGCVAAAVGEYRNPRVRDALLRVELFEMRSELDAFGLLARQRSETDDPDTNEAPGLLEIREAGAMGPGRLSFSDGRHLVNVLYQDLSPGASIESLDEATQEHLPAIARSLARAIPGETELPPELDLLPRERRVRRSERYDPDHLMGLEPLGPGVSALYGDPGPRYRLGVALARDEAGARHARDALAASLEQLTPLTGIGDGAFRGVTAGRATAFVAVRGSTLAVAAIEANGPSPDRSAVVATLALALQPPGARAGAEDPRPWRRGEPAIAAPQGHRDSGAPAAHTR